jgi:predicted NUDIX family phosphoesterase
MDIEHVLVIPNSIIKDIVNVPDPKIYKENIEELMDRVHKNYSFLQRDKAENDTNFKQIIPYAFITYEDYFYVMKRLPKQNETRLHNKVSIGVGGHINPIEEKSINIVEAGLMREIDEEVKLSKDHIKSIELKGIINDDTNEVGKVHLGFVYQITLTRKECQVAETDKIVGEWVHKNQINDYYSEMESWTQIIIDSL